MGRTFSAVPHTYLKRGVYYFVMVNIIFASASFAGNWNKGDGVLNPPGIDFGDFKPWQENELNFEDGYEMVPDPLNISQLVEKFGLDEFKCAKKDCDRQSSRWEKVENIYDHLPKGRRGQPVEAWYGWELYFRPDQILGAGQPRGPIIMGQFKENRGYGCPHLAFWHHTRHVPNTYELVLQKNTDSPPPLDCTTIVKRSLIDVKEMLGTWTRFEFQIRWSLGQDGFINGFVNGNQVVQYSGPTCFVDCTQFNNFRYGVYFANQRGLPLRPLDVYYKNVRRAPSRSGLLP